MPRNRKGKRRSEQVELTGLDAKLFWENVSNSGGAWTRSCGGLRHSTTGTPK